MAAAAIAEAANALFIGAVGAQLLAAGVTDAEFGLSARDAMLGFDGVRAYGAPAVGDPEDRLLTEAMGFERSAPGV